VAEDELQDGEEFPELGEDGLGAGTGDPADGPAVMVVRVACYLVGAECDDDEDDDDDDEPVAGLPDLQAGSARGSGRLPEAIEVTVTVNLAAPPRVAAKQATAAGAGWEELREAAADWAGKHAVNAVWPADQWRSDDGLFIEDAAQGLDAVADWFRGLVERPLSDVAAREGVPNLAAAAGAGVVATFVMRPITGPAEDTAKIMEVVGITVGLLTGLHPLVLACAESLTRSEVAELISKGLTQAISPAGDSCEAASASRGRTPAEKLAAASALAQGEPNSLFSPRHGKRDPRPARTILLVEEYAESTQSQASYAVPDDHDACGDATGQAWSAT
jgi:hypothetical protein